MADAWELLIANSTAPGGSDAWTHLHSQGSGSDAWEILVDASTLPEAPENDAWDHLNALSAYVLPEITGAGFILFLDRQRNFVLHLKRRREWG
jgi:hypothetical protein